MAKNPNNKPKQSKRDAPMNNAMKLFLAGLVAELYLLIVRKFYVHGVAVQQIAWYDVYLKLLMLLGAAVLVIGVVLSVLWKGDKKKRSIGWWFCGSGVFLAVATAMIWFFNAPAVTLLSVVVPVVMVLGILWGLYDRECALALTILGASLIALWVCRREMSSIFFGTYVKAMAVFYIVLLVLFALRVRAGRLLRVLPVNADPLPVYVACGLSVVAMLMVLVNMTAAYYAMWALAIVVFALAVYYTVKQL